MKLLTTYESIEEVLKGKSVARFGDGEIECIIFLKQGINTGNYNPLCWKQDYSVKLEKELLDVILKPNENVLVCHYPVFSNSNFKMWEKYATGGLNTALKMEKYLFGIFKTFGVWPDKIGNAFLFRDHLLEYDDKKEVYETLKKYISEKRVLLVSSREDDVNLEFFSKKEIEFIKCNHNNVYSQIDLLELEINKKIKEKNISLVLVSAGPTAGCLVNRMTRKNVQFLDAGQILRWHPDID